MHNTLTVLRAIVRLSRSRSNITVEALTERSAGSPTETRLAVRFLVEEGLVQVTERGVRPTLPGLAIAVASGQTQTRQKPQVAARVSSSPRVKTTKKVDRARRAA
jgi:hypothetical protein